MKKNNPLPSQKKGIPALVAAALLCMVLVFNANAKEQPAPQSIPPEASCAACGMHPHQYPAWQSQVIFSDGVMASFDGCKCMFRFLLNMQKFTTEHTPDQVAAIWVKDFSSGSWIDGKTAHYVINSTEMGPMGKELIPFATKAAADEFQKKKGGTLEIYQNINMETIKPLMGGGMHMKM